MAKDTQRDKARAVFGKSFFDNSKCPPAPKNSMAAQQKVANSRPIPTFKVGGPVKKAEMASRRAIRAEQDFSKPMMAAAERAAAKGTPVMKKGGATDEYTAKRVLARIEAGNFKDGGEARAKTRMSRKMADIEKDYKEALAKGRDPNIAKAKREQRVADARDDYAKWTKADRTQTRAAEKASEAALSEARRTNGVSVIRRDSDAAMARRMAEMDKPIETPRADISGLGAMPSATARTEARRPQTPVRRQVQVARVPAPKAPAAAPARAAPASAAAATPARAAPASAAAATAQAKAAPQPRTMTAAELRDKRAADLEAKAAAMRKLEEAPSGTRGSAFARLKNLVGFGSSGASSEARALRSQNRAQALAVQANQAEAANRAKAQERRKADYLKRAAAERAAGRSGNAAFYERQAARLKKGGVAKEGVSTRPTTPSGRRITIEELNRSNRDTGGMSAQELKAIGEAIARGNRTPYEPMPKPVKRAVGGAGKVRKGMVKGK